MKRLCHGNDTRLSSFGYRLEGLLAPVVLLFTILSQGTHWWSYCTNFPRMNTGGRISLLLLTVIWSVFGVITILPYGLLCAKSLVWHNSSYTLDDRGIHVNSMFKKRFYRWEEITRVSVYIVECGPLIGDRPRPYILLRLQDKLVLSFPLWREDVVHGFFGYFKLPNLFDLRNEVIAIRATDARLEELKRYWKGDVDDSAIRNSYQARFADRGKTRRRRERSRKRQST